jgi:hypothetical protein
MYLKARDMLKWNRGDDILEKGIGEWSRMIRECEAR